MEAKGKGSLSDTVTVSKTLTPTNITSRESQNPLRCCDCESLTPCLWLRSRVLPPPLQCQQRHPRPPFKYQLQLPCMPIRSCQLPPPSAMASPLIIAASLPGFLLCLALSAPALRAAEFQTYIVQLHPEVSGEKGSDWHLSFLREAAALEGGGDDDHPSSRILYSYRHAIEGFSARLSGNEAAALRRARGVIAVRPDRRVELHTTYSYEFLGLGLGLGLSRDDAWGRTAFGAGAIIGVLDTGVWPESPSFRDDGMPPVPRRWKGVCQAGEYFNSSSCNRKLIGARYYSKGHRSSAFTPPMPAIPEYTSPRDAHGHGTHTASTIAGSTVRGASVLGIGAGDARGMAPGAHLAVYKVCWFNGCYSSDILAGMDDAISDGVDVLSLSLGGFPLPFFEDSIAIGGFRATEKGVIVVCAAGNNGPVPYSVANEAPWMTTVGASTLDRRFPAFLRLGDGQLLYGESMFPGNHFSKFGGKEPELELTYITEGNRGGEHCFKGSLSKPDVGGKMVVCDRGVNSRAEKGEVVREAGGAAMVLANGPINQEEDSVDVHVLPATVIGYDESVRLQDYMNSTKRPVARIVFGGTRVQRARAPAVALFSSRGPSLAIPSTLKPDLIAPGVNIIAAWPQNLGPSGLPEDTRRSDFSVLSGTSMACPHVSGIAALVRSAHPSWSPAMVKSALMTTADVLDHYGKPIMDGKKPAGVLAMGSGHINPTRAIDPGLVYDIKPEDYVVHLCTLGYTRPEIFTITHRNISCSSLLQENKLFSLNYPSMSVVFKHGRTREIVQRTLTNVGLPNSTYSVRVAVPEGVSVTVAPESLTFGAAGESRSYSVVFQTENMGMEGKRSFAEGHLTWVHRDQKKYRVRSPISVTWG